MRDPLFEYETTPEAAGEEQPAEPVEPDGPQAPSEDWYDSPEAQSWVEHQIQQRQFQEWQYGQQAQQAPSLDWLDDESRQQLDRYIDARIAPAIGAQEQAALAEAEARAYDILSDNATRLGDFDVDVARLRADQLLPRFQQRYGFTPKAAEAALEQAAQEQRDYEQQLMKKGEESYQNQLSTLSGAPQIPAAAGQPGNGVHVTPEGGDERDLVRKYFPIQR